jgi:hypothetical protein
MMRWFRRTLRVAAFGMLAWAVVTELRKPREERTWEGSLAGVVPYDFRLPTPARVRQRWWNHDDEVAQLRRSVPRPPARRPPTPWPPIRTLPSGPSPTDARHAAAPPRPE